MKSVLLMMKIMSYATTIYTLHTRVGQEYREVHSLPECE